MGQRHSPDVRFSAELNKLQADLDRIKSQLEHSPSNDRKMMSYLEEIEAQTDGLTGRLQDWRDTGTGTQKDIARGLREARDRLAIAKRAAQARLH